MDPESLVWAKQTVAELIESAPDYQHQALYQAVLAALIEQDRRLGDRAGELDGRAWGGKRG